MPISPAHPRSNATDPSSAITPIHLLKREGPFGTCWLGSRAEEVSRHIVGSAATNSVLQGVIPVGAFCLLPLFASRRVSLFVRSGITYVLLSCGSDSGSLIISSSLLFIRSCSRLYCSSFLFEVKVSLDQRC